MADKPSLDIYLNVIASGNPRYFNTEFPSQTADKPSTYKPTKESKYSIEAELKASDDSIPLDTTKGAICDAVFIFLRDYYFSTGVWGGDRHFIGIIDQTDYKAVQKDGGAVVTASLVTKEFSTKFSLDFTIERYFTNIKDAKGPKKENYEDPNVLKELLSDATIKILLSDEIKKEILKSGKLRYFEYNIHYGLPPSLEDTVFIDEGTEVTPQKPRLTDAIKIHEQRPITAVSLETPEIEPEEVTYHLPQTAQLITPDVSDILPLEEPQDAIPYDTKTRPLDPFEITDSERDLTRNNGHKKHPTATELEPLKDLAEDDPKWKRKDDTSSLMPL